MLIIFSVPYLIWRGLRTEDYAPLVVVQIIAGVLLGPGVLGAAFPDAHATVFNPQVIMALNGVAWWAVMIFIFIAGLELDLSQAWTHRVETGVTAGLALGSFYLTNINICVWNYLIFQINIVRWANTPNNRV